MKKEKSFKLTDNRCDRHLAIPTDLVTSFFGHLLRERFSHNSEAATNETKQTD